MQEIARLTTKLKKLSLPKNVVYCDAAYEAKTRKACIGYVTEDLKDMGYEFVVVENINEAEKRAVQLALAKYPNYIVCTDSKYAEASFPNGMVKYVPRRMNLANIVVRSAVEMTRSRVPHK